VRGMCVSFFEPKTIFTTFVNVRPGCSSSLTFSGPVGAWSSCTMVLCASSRCPRNCATTFAKFGVISLGLELYLPIPRTEE
jgi:hypothetical protein